MPIFAQADPVEDVTMVPVSVIPVIPPETVSPTAFPASLLPVLAAERDVEPEGWHGAVPPAWVPIIARYRYRYRSRYTMH